MNLRTLVLSTWVVVLLVKSVSGVTFTVTNTADSGVGSLRQAITDANGTMGADTIAFNIPSTDPNCNSTTHVCTITPATVLPTITDTVTINGYTQTGASANTLAGSDNAVILIQLNGATVEAGQRPAFRIGDRCQQLHCAWPGHQHILPADPNLLR